MLEHLCVDLEQESREALATWVLVQIYTQSSLDGDVIVWTVKGVVKHHDDNANTIPLSDKNPK
jgi:hypothetical protein